VNGEIAFHTWAHGYPQFFSSGRIIEKYSDGKYYVAVPGTFYYAASAVTTWPWEATFTPVNSGASPAPSVTALGKAEFSALPTSISVNFTAVQYPEITITGHNHVSLPHSTVANTSNIAGLFPASGFGVPSFGVTLGDASPVAASLTIAIDHFDVPNADGTHLHGENTKNISGGLSVSFVGIPTTATEAAIETAVKADFATNGITVDHFLVGSTDKNTTNQDFESFAFNAQIFV
jgi:hypothetical protein